jgi:hypothetical protein
MPYDEADETDPLLLMGMEVEAGETSTLESARVFAEEFARMGFDEESLMDIFRNPFYAAAHRAYLALGEEAVGALVREQAGLWGRIRLNDRDTDPESGMLELPVLQPHQEE